MFPDISEGWLHVLLRHEPSNLKSALRLYQQGVNRALVFTYNDEFSGKQLPWDNFITLRFQAVNVSNKHSIDHPENRCGAVPHDQAGQTRQHNKLYEDR